MSATSNSTYGEMCSHFRKLEKLLVVSFRQRGKLSCGLDLPRVCRYSRICKLVPFVSKAMATPPLLSCRYLCLFFLCLTKYSTFVLPHTPHLHLLVLFSYNQNCQKPKRNLEKQRVCEARLLQIPGLHSWAMWPPTHALIHVFFCKMGQ